MIKFDRTHLDLGKHSIVPVAFEFKGVSRFDVEVNVTSKTSCGCTKATHPESVKPGEFLTITGSFVKKSKSVFKKTVTITCSGEGVSSEQTLTFSVEII